MRNTPTINEKANSFLARWRLCDLPSPELLKDYISIADKLLFADEELTLKTIDLLKINVNLWATKNSPVYNQLQLKPYFSKADFENSENWYVQSLSQESQRMSTSGSTTGKCFPYLRWNRFLRQIEGDNHYDLILDEFGISRTPNVAYMLMNNVRDVKEPISKVTSSNFTEHHGIHRKAKIHFAQKTNLYFENQEKYFEYVLEYLAKNEIDVILTSGPIISSLAHHVKRLGFDKKITRLLSNTCELMFKKDVGYLQKAGVISECCDHMRCWDGGAGFFSCRYGTYHLMDNLSFCEEFDGKLISTDYFSLPSPFIKFWNGDLCEINNSYKRCQCGRLYRPFKFLQSRPFSVKGKCITDLREKVKQSGIKGIKQIKCGNSKMEIVSNIILSTQDKNQLNEILQGFDLVFTTEQTT